MEGVDYSEDLLYDGRHMIRYRAERTMTKNTHGTGCALSSALATLLPSSTDIPMAAREASVTSRRRSFTQDELQIGKGHGPVHHFYAQWY